MHTLAEQQECFFTKCPRLNFCQQCVIIKLEGAMSHFGSAWTQQKIRAQKGAAAGSSKTEPLPSIVVEGTQIFQERLGLEMRHTECPELERGHIASVLLSGRGINPHAVSLWELPSFPTREIISSSVMLFTTLTRLEKERKAFST